MPGLLRGVARTAVIAGTATSVSNRVSRRQANRWAQQEQQQYPPQQQYEQQQYYQQPAPPPQPTSGADERLAQLRQLGELRDQGVLTDAEFEAQKSRILNS